MCKLLFLFLDVSSFILQKGIPVLIQKSIRPRFVIPFAKYMQDVYTPTQVCAWVILFIHLTCLYRSLFTLTSGLSVGLGTGYGTDHVQAIKISALHLFANLFSLRKYVQLIEFFILWPKCLVSVFHDSLFCTIQ